MIQRITLVNGENQHNTFPPTFTAAVERAGLAQRDILSRDCALAIDDVGTVSVLHEGAPIDGPTEAFFIRSHKHDEYFTYLLEKALTHSGSTVFTDPANTASERAADKQTVTLTLALAGLPVPASILCTPHSFTQNEAAIRSRITFPCVLKKTGARGKQVWKIDDEAQLREKLLLDERLTLIQEYIPNDHDFRVFVFDSEILATIKRTTADGFYNNVSQGGAALPGTITEAEAAMCIEAAQVADLRIAGVDFVRRTDGSAAIFEVNKNPQLSLFSEAAGFDLEQAVSERVIERLQEHP